MKRSKTLNRPLLAVVSGVLVWLTASPAFAEFDPVTPGDLPRLVARRAKLYLARPARGRGRGEAVQLYAGDTVTAVELYRFSPGDRPSPTFVVVQLAGGAQQQALHIEDLSKRPLDYSQRGKVSFDVYWTGLAVDAVRLMELFHKTLARHGYQRPQNDPVTRQLSDDWHRIEHLRRQLEYVRGQLFDRAYGNHDERRLIEREKDWLPARGEEFITQYAGQLAPEKRKRMQSVYLVMNSLSNVPHFCFKIGELQQAIDRPPEAKYRNLEPAHRARLQAEDIARMNTEITELKAKLVVILSEARAKLLLAGIKPR